jgi:ATP-dependent Clp protease ATP-binding subunit ClpA
MARVQVDLHELQADQQELRGPLMHGYNFTERVRKVLAMAREESVRLRHEYVGTEHILLGLVREGEGVAATILQNLGVDLDDIQQKIDETVKKGTGRPTGPDLPYTSRAKKVLELAMSEARELNHSYVGTEHLLLGLVREEKGIAAQVLVDAGITLDSAREETVRILGENGMSKPKPVADESEHAAIARRMRFADPEWRAIIARALEIAEDRRARPGVADLLEALVFSSREVAAAFASREIEMQGLIAEIRELTDPPASEQAPI